MKHFSAERQIEGRVFAPKKIQSPSPYLHHSQFSDPISPNHNRRTSIDVRMGQNASWLNLTGESKYPKQSPMQLSILKVFPD